LKSLNKRRMRIQKGNNALTLLQNTLVFALILLFSFLSSDSLRFTEKELKTSTETEVVEKNFEGENETENHEVTFQTQIRHEIKVSSNFFEINLINLEHAYSELLPTPPPEA
jgi:hypothetical protein